MIRPGQTIGILGGGQLGRMLILAGRVLGFRFHVFDPQGPSTAGMLADLEINADYGDRAALRRFAEGVDLITLEFENIPASAIETLAAHKPVHPGKQALHICQNRQREKDFLRAGGFPVAPFAYADSASSLAEAFTAVGFPCVIKTAAFGYDGKGQIRIDRAEAAADSASLWAQLGQPERVVVEQWIEHAGEFSVICARRSDGVARTLPMAENIHVDHILHASVVPARVDPSVAAAGAKLAEQIATQLNVVGLIAVEFFLDGDGQLLVNELAPRPHNSGHTSIDACQTSQFEQHIRAVAGLPLGAVGLHRPAVMINLLGDLWEAGPPDWTPLLEDPAVKLHLYDKGEPRPGRKMGHFTVLRDDPSVAHRRAEAHFARLAAAARATSPAGLSRP